MIMDRKTTRRDIRPVHPGTVLKTEFLDELPMSVASLARALNVPRTRLNDIVLGRRGITADTAYRLGRYFGMDPRFWLNLQAHYELEQLRDARSDIDAQVAPRAA
jgi:antitoxin HigA-1